MALKYFYRVHRDRFVKEKCCQIYPGMEFLEQNLESKRNFNLKSCSERGRNLLISSVLSNNNNRGTNRNSS
jgi:hypothetical protein